ncbi:MAG: tetratricopeptide repeat protein [Caulobacteraceae bacterium]|nr:tetratricopeptide repeat protein [Caulobacteraceae bacterium]
MAICLSLALCGNAAAAVDDVAPPTDQGAQDRPPPADDAHCTTCDGMRLLRQGEYGRAMHVFQLRAAVGDLVATHELGIMYQQGLGVAVDFDRARSYFTKGMNAGDGAGMASLGWMYEQGLGVAVDYQQARRYYKMAKAAGDPFGATLLGITYQHGLGVPIDYGQAMRLYHEAIVGGGDGTAMNQIGFMLQHGLGVPPNLKEAWCWYAWADANGEPHAPTHLAELTVAGQQPVEDCSVLNQWPVKVRPKAAADGAPVQRQP